MIIVQQWTESYGEVKILVKRLSRASVEKWRKTVMMMMMSGWMMVWRLNDGVTVEWWCDGWMMVWRLNDGVTVEWC